MKFALRSKISNLFIARVISTDIIISRDVYKHIFNNVLSMLRSAILNLVMVNMLISNVVSVRNSLLSLKDGIIES